MQTTALIHNFSYKLTHSCTHIHVYIYIYLLILKLFEGCVWLKENVSI